MSTSEIEKALAVLRGIGDRDAYLATKYMNPEKYVQHNPHAADGVDGLKEYISQFPRENHHLKVVRAFQDGPFVFTQEEGLILGQNVFFDIFRLKVDTHGYTDFGMALSHGEGFDLCPRLKALKDRHLFLPRGYAVPEILKPICEASLDFSQP